MGVASDTYTIKQCLGTLEAQELMSNHAGNVLHQSLLYIWPTATKCLTKIP